MSREVSRRAFLRRGAGLLGGSQAAETFIDVGRSEGSDLVGWVTDGKRSVIAENKATVERVLEPSTTLCSGGELYECRTCSGTSFHVLVGFGTSQPTVGEVYRIDPTGETDWCRSFEVRLERTEPCGGSASIPSADSATAAETATGGDGTESTTGTAETADDRETVTGTPTDPPADAESTERETEDPESDEPGTDETESPTPSRTPTANPGDAAGSGETSTATEQTGTAPSESSTESPVGSPAEEAQRPPRSGGVLPATPGSE